MPRHASLRSIVRSRRNLAYVLAAVLPTLATPLVEHVHWLHAYPFSLYFIAMGLVCALGGWGPMATAVAAILVSRWWFLGQSLDPASLGPTDRLRFASLLVSMAIVSFVSQRRSRTEVSLAEALGDLQERTDALVDALHASKCACWTLHLGSGRSARWYGGSYPVFGRPFSEVEAMPSLGPLVHDDDQAGFAEVAEHMRHSSEPVVFAYRCLWPNGELHWLEMRATHLPGPEPRWRGLTLDVTERRAAEAGILRAEKLAAMGRLASTVAHEVNNPLEAVTNLLYLAMLDPALAPETRGFLATAEGELARLANVTRFTLDLAPASAGAAHVDLAEALDGVLAVFHHRAELRRARIDRRYAPGTAVAVAPYELQQMLTNLFSNAADALMHVAEPRLSIEVTVDAQTAALVLADNGSGIDPAHLERVFEPFYSTKPDVGTGLGLWVTRELVEKCGGRIAVVSGALPDGISTSFRIELPLARLALS